jgi:FAD-dependent oxidoreductase domain-containing protein 1
LGRNCGILNPNLLSRFYEERIVALGGSFAYGTEVTGFATNGQGLIIGVKTAEQQIRYGTVVIATGAWINQTMSLASLEVPVAPRKRQLFAVAAKTGPLARLIHAEGFNSHGLVPLTIMPGGAYLRPSVGAFILGYANNDQPPGLEEKPAAEQDFFQGRLRPQIARCFPAFQDVTPDYAWAGHYADHLADSHPIVDRMGGAIIVGGASGSGIMKADSLGRIVAGLYYGLEQVDLGHGRPLRVKDLALTSRSLSPEGMII